MPDKAAQISKICLKQNYISQFYSKKYANTFKIFYSTLASNLVE